MSTYKQIVELIKQLYEDAAPTNSVGGGNVASVGVGLQGEPPGVPKLKQFKLFRRRVPK